MGKDVGEWEILPRCEGAAMVLLDENAPLCPVPASLAPLADVLVWLVWRGSDSVVLD